MTDQFSGEKSAFQSLFLKQLPALNLYFCNDVISMPDSKNQYSLLNLLKYRFNLDEEKAEESKIIQAIKDNVEFKGTNLWTLIFAILIASIGLNVNSTAVIIGAMLISPLMGPIMGIGLGLGIFDFVLIKNALKNLLVAVAISLITSTVYFIVSPLHEAHGELLARTTPTIWDVLIALFGGLAGIIASSKKSITNAIPGVAIATALMPPLCTAGYGLGTGNLYYFVGAFYLFLINGVFISIATFLIVRFLKFKPAHYVDQEFENKVRKYVWGIAIITIIPSVYLAYRFVQQEIFKQNVQTYIEKEIKVKDLFVIDKAIEPAKRKVKLFIYGENMDDSTSKKIIAARTNYDLQDAEVSIEQTMRTNGKEELADQRVEMTSVIEKQMFEKDKKIAEISSRLRDQFQTVDSSLFKEFSALYGEPKELIISKTLMFNEVGRDTVTLIYYKFNRQKRIDKRQLENWLKERSKSKHIKILAP